MSVGNAEFTPRGTPIDNGVGTNGVGTGVTAPTPSPSPYLAAAFSALRAAYAEPTSPTNVTAKPCGSYMGADEVAKRVLAPIAVRA